MMLSPRPDYVIDRTHPDPDRRLSSTLTKKKDTPMQLEIDIDAMQGHANKAIDDAMSAAFAGHDVKKALQHSVVAQLLDSGLATALAAELQKSMDLDAVVKAIAKEFARSVIRAATATLNESLVSTLVKLRLDSNYASREEIAAMRTTVIAETGIGRVEL